MTITKILKITTIPKNHNQIRQTNRRTYKLLQGIHCICTSFCLCNISSMMAIFRYKKILIKYLLSQYHSSVTIMIIESNIIVYMM